MQTHLQHLWIKVEAGLLQSLIKLVCWDGCNSGHRHFVYHLAGMPLTNCEFGRPPWSHARLPQTCAGRRAWQWLLPSPAKVNQKMVSGTQQRIDAVGGRQVQPTHMLAPVLRSGLSPSLPRRLPRAAASCGFLPRIWRAPGAGGTREAPWNTWAGNGAQPLVCHETSFQL